MIDHDQVPIANIGPAGKADKAPIGCLHRRARRRGDVVLDDVVCVKEIDKASPKLAESICNGKVFPKVEIHLTASYTDAGRVTYYAYELKNVQVTSYNISGSGQAEQVPTENFSLNFEEIKVTYTECDAAGKKTLRLAVGCTGGRHRSVAVVERLAVALNLPEVELTVFHRDIERDG